MIASGWPVVAGLAVFAAAQVTSHPAALAPRRLGRLSPATEVRRPRSRRPLLLLAVAGAGLAISVVGAVTVVVLAVVAAGGSLALRRARRTRAHEQMSAAVVELCRATAAELRAGRHVTDAFVTAARAAPETLAEYLRPGVTIGRRGDVADLTAVVVACAANDGCAGLRKLAACWRVAAVSGAALAPAIDRVADALQDEIDVGRDVASALAGPKATVRVLAGLPVIGLLLGTAIGARPLDFLLHTGPGVGCLLAAGAFDIAGVTWAKRIARAPMLA
jgi:tight adherence protein B